ncbi:MAG: DPP IV N-terminal domain-containing protein [Phycisphaerales bacterium]
MVPNLRFAAAFAAVVLPAAARSHAQTFTPMKDLPGGALVNRMQSALGGIGGGGTASELRWELEAGRLWFNRDGWRTLELATGAIAEAGGEPPESAVESPRQRNGRGERRPARGRQFTTAESPDGAWTAVSENGNLFLAPKDGERIALTDDGSDDFKYGQASWVYGEELDQTTAMWWSPDSRYIAFYRFDESRVPDFYILGGWTDRNTRVVSEAYPKPGQPNPTARIMIHDLVEKRTVEVDSFSAESGAAEGAEYYIFNVRWTPDGSELLYSRTPRRQDVLEVLAVDPSTGASRPVVREEQEAWQDNRPLMRFLEDGKRFIWETERSGFRQFELRALDGASIAVLTDDTSPVESIVSLDEDAGELWYTAWSGPVAVQQQLHVARLDGSGWSRVTTGEFHHTNFRMSPDGAFVVATAQATQVPPHDVVYACPAKQSKDAKGGAGRRAAGRLVAKLGEGSVKGFAIHALTQSELFTCLAADGKTTLYGKLHFPPAFDPARKYPLVVETYGGPTVRLVTDTFSAGKPETALGFILMTVDNRGTPGRGKAFETAAYLNLGVVDADDQAAAVQHLVATRPYIDGARVGITGHSYGGYMSAICVIRRGDVFAAGVAGAPPTDWRQYDTIYTERYMRTPEENPEGYDAGSCVKQAGKLRGKLLLLHGMVDDNVHPNNTFELANALQSINRPFSMMMFPNSGHGIWSPAVESVKWSFFVDALAPEAPEWGTASAPAKDGAES